MTAPELLQALRACGVTLARAGDRLRYSPVSSVPAALLDELRAHKTELLALLGGPCAPSPSGEPWSALGLAQAFLAGVLAAGPRSAREIKRATVAAGVSWRTVQRAKTTLGIVARKSGNRGPWSWALPAHASDGGLGALAGTSGALEGRQPADTGGAGTLGEPIRDRSCDEPTAWETRKPEPSGILGALMSHGRQTWPNR